MVIQAVNVCDGNLRQLFLGNTLKTTDIHSVHFPNGRLIANPEGPDTTDLAEEMLILPCIEQILGEHLCSGYQPKPVLRRHGRPEPIPAAYRAVAPVRTLREIQIRLEANRPAVAATFVCLQHDTTPASLCGPAFRFTNGERAQRAHGPVQRSAGPRRTNLQSSSDHSDWAEGTGVRGGW